MPDPNISAIDHQILGVKCTRDGDYAQAKIHLQRALNLATEPSLRGRICRDLADVVRRYPSDLNLQWAEKLLQESLVYFGNMYPFESLYTKHYLARVYRATGNYRKAIQVMSPVVSAFEVWLDEYPNLVDSVKIQQLYMELDYSSMLALRAEPKEAFKHAWKALRLCFKLNASKSHKVRAFILLAFAANPLSTNEHAKRAFFGRESKSDF